MKKLIAILLLTVSIGCGSYANDESVIVTKELNDRIATKIYKYRYTVYAEFNDIVFYSNKEYNIGDKITFGEKK